MRNLIKQAGTQQDVAKMLRRSRRLVTFWAAGERLPDAADLAELLALAGVVSVHVESGADATVLHCYTKDDCGEPSVVLTLPKGRMGGDNA